MNALFFERFGGPEVLEFGEVPDPVPAEHEALVRTRAVGLNFADVYRRRGNYHLAGSPPFIAGYEAAGVDVSTGARVAFADSPYANANWSRSYERADPGARRYFTRSPRRCSCRSDRVFPGARHPCDPRGRTRLDPRRGGVGLLLVQIAKPRGAYVVGLASSEAKRAAALEAGADRAISYDDWTSERDFDVVYDSVGATLDTSLEVARTGGHVVFYGMAGGDPKPVDPRVLMDRSLTLSGGDLWNVLRTNADRVTRAEALFGWVRDGRIRVRIAERFPLARGADAHRYLESRAAIGKVLLVP